MAELLTRRRFITAALATATVGAAVRECIPSRTHEADELGAILDAGTSGWEPLMLKPLPYKPPNTAILEYIKSIQANLDRKEFYGG